MEKLQAHIQEVSTHLYPDAQATVRLSITDEQFGDYATNIALQLGKQLGKNPRDVAQELADAISHPDIAAVSVAGPGFINILLSTEALLSFAQANPTSVRASQTVVIETNNPNPFKAMHIGHAYNAIVADSVANIIERDGARTHRVSYHGDVGAHVGKSMYSILKFIEGDASKLQDIAPESRNSFMSKMYTEGSRAYKEDEGAKTEINELSKQSFTLDDPLFKEVYEVCKAWSFSDIDALVARLGNKAIEKRYMESEADAAGLKTVQENIDEVFVKSDGAIIFPGKQYGAFDNAFVSSTGKTLYGARDLGLMQLKQNDFHPDKSYMVTGGEQRDYFRGVIKAAELCLPELTGVTENISTGLDKLSTGKMSSRTGDVVEIHWLFDQIDSGLQARGGAVNEDIVRGAIRYEFLKVKIGGDVVFDVQESISIHGNSGPYLQYAHARARSILAKTMAPEALLDGEELTADERSLVRKLSHYGQTQEKAIEELAPHIICTYLYELAQSFNRFYEHNRVVGDDREKTRAYLVQQYANTLKDGLELLGITAVEKM
jgi:arginyl-tRNA synthetase